MVNNFKHILKTNGVLFITTRSKRFLHHSYPYDYWRFELLDMEEIYSDFIVQYLEKDSMMPSITMKAIKPRSFIENDLSNY